MMIDFKKSMQILKALRKNVGKETQAKEYDCAHATVWFGMLSTKTGRKYLADCEMKFLRYKGFRDGVN